MNYSIRTLEQLFDSGSILVWGGGTQSRTCIRYLKKKTNAKIHLFDSDEKKVGLNIEGVTIEERKKFKRYLENGDCCVLISSINNQYSIAQMLIKEYGVALEVLYGYTNDFYEENIFKSECSYSLEADIEKVRSMLSDEESRDYFDASIRYRFNRNPLELVPNRKMQRIGEYADIVKVHEGDTIIDCGAYTGDTAEMYCGYIGNRCKVYAFEPFAESFQKLEQRIREKQLTNVHALNYAVSDENRTDTICFDDVDMEMGMKIGEKVGDKVEIVQTRTLDTILGRDETINFIKMDIEGEEMNALNGAKNIIKKFAPDVMISAYHKFEHILEVPQFLKNINSSYNIYVGHAPNVSTEIEIYATVKSNGMPFLSER